MSYEPKRKGLALIFYYQLQTLFSYGDYTYNLHDTRPHFPAQYTAAGAAPLTTEYRRAAELTQRGDSRLYQRAVFLCGGDHTLTAFCPLAGQPQTRQKGYIYGIFQ